MRIGLVGRAGCRRSPCQAAALVKIEPVFTGTDQGALRAKRLEPKAVGNVMHTMAERKMAGKGGPGRGSDEEGKTGLVTKTRPKTKKPSLYKVLLLNDDYTPMEFVVHVLERYFNKGRDDATRIMLHVHQKGVGICGVYTYEVAETKVTQVMDFARQNGHPLQCTLEKE